MDLAKHIRERIEASGPREKNELLETAAEEIQRLETCMEYEQHIAGRIGTHGPGCYAWGPAHYRCALVQIETLKTAIQQTLDENGHLADGDVCTLILLKRAIETPNV